MLPTSYVEIRAYRHSQRDQIRENITVSINWRKNFRYVWKCKDMAANFGLAMSLKVGSLQISSSAAVITFYL